MSPTPFYLPPTPANPVLITTKPFPKAVSVLFYDTLSLTGLVCVIMGLELSIGACWAHQWVQLNK